VSQLVVDCSATMAWFFADEKTPAAMFTLQQVMRDGAVVPAIWPIEVANVLTIGQRRGRVIPADADRFLIDLAAMPIAIETGTLGQSLARCLNLARTHGLTAYDAQYLELAQRRSLKLHSKDVPLLRAAAAEGVSPVDVSQ
jgi:predicted nucleic acid-binding protein